ncbi:MAG: S41 family peptidase [Candidatus Gracilibacteria bacterium]|nr:S41 family peptidase [Candidatus Gracilibacteria bacterium]
MNNIDNKNNFAQFIVIFLTSFILGIVFSFTIGIDFNNNLLKSEEGTDIFSITSNKDLDLTKYWEVYNLIKTNNYDSDSVDKIKLVDSTIKGLVLGLGDKNSEYFNKEDTKKFNEVLSGDFEGIGAVVEVNELGVIIDRLIKGSPAKKYGLENGDIIIKANDVKLEGLPLYDAVDKIKGPAGTHVKLEVLRKGELNILYFDVLREKIKIPSVDSEVFDDGKIAYISINMFGDDTSREFQNLLKQYMNTNGLIIDLRDNGGGYLQSAVTILSELIENDKTLVVTKYKDIFSNIKYPSINDGNIYKGKIVVLINENSASASEITAGALKDYKKAILVGKKSYGKGSVQKPFDLSDGSMLKLTIAKWFTPNDINIDKEGITPDIEVGFEKEDFEKSYDRQLETAKEVLKTFISTNTYQLSIDKYKSEHTSSGIINKNSTGTIKNIK